MEVLNWRFSTRWKLFERQKATISSCNISRSAFSRKLFHANGTTETIHKYSMCFENLCSISMLSSTMSTRIHTHAEKEWGLCDLNFANKYIDRSIYSNGTMSSTYTFMRNAFAFCCSIFPFSHVYEGKSFVLLWHFDCNLIRTFSVKYEIINFCAHTQWSYGTAEVNACLEIQWINAEYCTHTQTHSNHDRFMNKWRKKRYFLCFENKWKGFFLLLYMCSNVGRFLWSCNVFRDCLATSFRIHISTLFGFFSRFVQ